MSRHGPDRRLVGIVCVLGGVLCFSSSSSLVKWAGVSGAAIAFWRLFLTAVLWWVVLGLRRARRGAGPPPAAVWKQMIPVGLCFGLNITVFFSAIPHTSIAHAEFITALSPLLLVPAGAIFFGERPDNRALLWGLVTLAGLAIVLFAGGDQGGATVGGDLLILVVVLFWAGYLLIGRQARATVDLVDFMAVTMNLAFVVAAPVTLVIASNDILHMTARGWLVAGILCVLTGMLAHGLIASAQRDIDVGTISILQVCQPALAVAWAYVILGESIAWVQVPGMLLVLLGLAAFTVVSQRRGTVVSEEPPLAHAGLEHVAPTEPGHAS